MRLVDFNLKRYFPLPLANFLFNRNSICLGKQFYYQVFRRRCIQSGIDGYFALIYIRCKMDCFNKILGTRLEVNGLPDAGSPTIALLTFQLKVMRRVIHAKNKLVLPGRPEFEFKRRVSPLVFSQLFTIQPGRRFPVAGADNKKNPFAIPGIGNLNCFFVPANISFISHTGKFRPP